MTSKQRKSLLTFHTSCTSIWLGCVVAYLVLTAIAFTGDDPLVVSTWASLRALVLYVIIPSAMGSFVTGILIAHASPWGLFKHKWVSTSFAMTAILVAVLLAHTSKITEHAMIASRDGVAAIEQLRMGLKG